MQVKVLVYLDYYRMDGVVYWTTKEEKGIAQVSFIKRTPSGEKKQFFAIYEWAKTNTVQLLDLDGGSRTNQEISSLIYLT